MLTYAARMLTNAAVPLTAGTSPIWRMVTYADVWCTYADVCCGAPYRRNLADMALPLQQMWREGLTGTEHNKYSDIRSVCCMLRMRMLRSIRSIRSIQHTA
jgi:hypothetical protein